MSEEIFDVVNEHDEVIDQRPRSEVHRLGLRHRAVHVLVFNAEGKVFLQKRSASKDTHPQTWDSSTSGHVDSGEDYDRSAMRELEEEIGLTVEQPPTRLFKIDACKETDQEFVWVYRTESEGPFQLHPDEIEDGAWFSCREVSAWIHARPEEFASGFRHLWRLAAEHGHL